MPKCDSRASKRSASTVRPALFARGAACVPTQHALVHRTRSGLIDSYLRVADLLLKDAESEAFDSKQDLIMCKQELVLAKATVAQLSKELVQLPLASTPPDVCSTGGDAIHIGRH